MTSKRPAGTLTINALSLMAATVATNAVGLIFWAVAARLEPASRVGHASAAVAAATLCATIAQLNLTNVFIRLIPQSGNLGRALILKGYVAVVLFALAIGGLYVVTGLSTHVIASSWPAGVGFTLAVAMLAIFALQDSVLTSLRLAPWVTVENVSFALSKLALLPILVLLLGSVGVVIAWFVPALICVVVVTWLLLHRVLPSRKDMAGKLPTRARLLNFIAAEYVANICATATTQAMPILIVWRLGASEAAYFTLPWFIAAGITFLMWNIGSSFVVELANSTENERALIKRSGALLAGVIALAMVVCVVGARPLLEVLGANYARNGAPLLRLIGLSTPFVAIVAIYTALAWLDQRVWLLAALQAVSGGLLIFVALSLMDRLGIAAVGWAYLGTQVVAALFMAPLAVNRLRAGQLLRTA